MLIAGIICVISLVLIGLMALGSSNSGPSPVSLAAKFNVLTKISTKYGPKLRTSALQDTNSALKASLTTANQSLSPIMAANGANSKQATAQIAQLSNTTEIEKRLDDAALNSTLDETYSREITYLLQDAMITMDRLYRSTNSKTVRDFLEKTTNDFKNLYKQFGGTVEDNSQASLFTHQSIAQPSQI